MGKHPNSLKNLENGNRFASDEATRVAGAKGARARKRNHDIRKLAKTLLSAETEVDAGVLDLVRKSGFPDDEPETIMLFLVRLKSLALSKSVDPRASMDAIRLILEMSGDDVKSRENADRRAIERERLRLEERRLEAMIASKTVNDDIDPVTIIRSPDGGIKLESDLDEQ